VPTRPKSTTSAPISGRLTLSDRRRRGRDRRDIHRHESGRHGPGPRGVRSGDETHVDRAVAAASDAFDEWKETSWEERVAIFRDAADVIQDRKLEITALMAYENAKHGTRAIAEVDEATDFLRYYSSELERNEGYTADNNEPTPGQRCVSDLQPYGVFGVVAPFNFRSRSPSE